MTPAPDGVWLQPKPKRRQPRNHHSSPRSLTSPSTGTAVAQSLRDRVSFQAEIASESDAFDRLPANDRLRRVEALCDTVRQLHPTVSASPLYCALKECLAVRVAAQASLSSEPAVAARLYSADLVCYGIGRFSLSPSARLQLAVLLALHSSLSLAPSCSLQLYDPLLSSLELAALRTLGVDVLERNEEAKRRVSQCTVFFMPHCGQALYNNLLWANWGWVMRDEELHSQRLTPSHVASSVESAERHEKRSVDDELSSQLCSVHVSSARSSVHLGHVVLIGNQLSAYTDKRTFPSTHSAPLTAYTRRRPVQTPPDYSNRCPVHSKLPTSPAAASASGCEYECVCLVDALGLLQCRSLESELSGSSAEMRLAFHDTAVQWFELADVGGGERQRAEQWLQQRVAEPRRLADDGEFVSSAAETVVRGDT